MDCPRTAPRPDFLPPESKGRVVAGLRSEFDRFWFLAVEPKHWTSPTACAGWETKDLVGHLLDVVRGDLERSFDPDSVRDMKRSATGDRQSAARTSQRTRSIRYRNPI